MTNGARSDLFDELSTRIAADVSAIDSRLSPVEVDVFFADELLFASATVRDDAGGIHWRSSHAATPDSTGIADLRSAGEELVDRIITDARIASIVESDSND